jgi:hypothetical protein
MSTSLSRFAFIDSVHAAEALRVSQETVLDWIASGRLKSYGGKAGNPFLRSVDVAALVEELGVSPDEPPRRTKSATARVQARLTADSRWSDIGEAEIREWAQRADSPRRQAARTAAGAALNRLQVVLTVLDDMDGPSSGAVSGRDES